MPIEFILNDDGSVSFGPAMYEWVKNWRDYIISTHENAAIYQEQGFKYFIKSERMNENLKCFLRDFRDYAEKESNYGKS